MKRQVAAWIVAVFLVVGLSKLVGQQFTAQMGTGALTTCPVPVAGSNILCSVTDGVYASISGSAYAKINATSGGVLTFNTRTGNVLPVIGDYTFPMIQGQLTAAQLPASVVCNVSLSVNGTAQKATISACN